MKYILFGEEKYYIKKFKSNNQLQQFIRKYNITLYSHNGDDYLII